MNDAPPIAEPRPLDGKAVADLGRQLTELLRLRTLPIGMKLFDSEEEMAKVPGLRRPAAGRKFSTCQLVTQARIAERHAEWAAQVRDALAARGLRVLLDDRNEKLNFKIREAETQKIPVMAVVGDQEVASGTVTPRRRHGAKGAAEAQPLDAFVAELSAAVAERRPRA